MLHPLREARCATSLYNMVQFQKEVLAFACSPEHLTPLSRENVNAFFSKAQDWIWAKLWRYGKPANGASNLQKSLRAVAAHIRLHPELQSLILEIFDHDTGWIADLNSDSFRFKFRVDLDDTTRGVIGALLEAFYTELFAEGVPSEVHGGEGNLDLHNFKTAFWEANGDLLACPACDKDKPDNIRMKDASDADHFFPKSKYPCLSIHPRNLVPLCLECNQRAKLNRDPLRDQSDALLGSTFHPYAEQGARDVLTIRVEREEHTGAHRVQLLDGQAQTSRLESLIHVWDLEGRWTHRMKAVVASVIEAVTDRAIDAAASSENNFAEVLAQLERKRRRRLGTQPHYVLQAGYLRYALSNEAEKAALYREYAISSDLDSESR